MTYTEAGLALLALAGWFGFLVERLYFTRLAEANSSTVRNFKAAIKAKDDTIELLETRIKTLVAKAERVVILHDRQERLDGAIEVLRIHTTPIDGKVT